MSGVAEETPDLGEQLREAISRSSGDLSSSKPKLGLRRNLESKYSVDLAPALAYGRHRGPARDDSRQAAVVIAMFQRDDGQWMIPLTMRPTSLQHHGGQICLPGGQIEAGESITDAALREYEEELGVKANVSVHCGQLSTKYVFASDNRVYPVVVTTQTPSSSWKPDPAEVAEVITLPLSQLLITSNRSQMTKTKPVCQNGQTVGQLTYRAPAIEYGNHSIWGATALILDELANYCNHLQRSFRVCHLVHVDSQYRWRDTADTETSTRCLEPTGSAAYNSAANIS